ncbi:hypothetical protein CY34DRAFT_18709 [Suillus luteus UH-Slu-Lm8-n1]|uniref:Uncharacterized protein n=1 Tax=Suillus luteus UH-Slu-Lm8-n1 TaxID=930992 RepID=A0A0D0AFE9_9AGAM|nr:hypothetical protein CY34DRAFT_18709 [Suillus luteus UH-Slu-Lm8-n1]
MENLALDVLSPLVIPVLAQFAAKLAGGLLAPSDALAIAGDLIFLRIISGKKDDATMPKNLYSQYAWVTAAIRREVSFQSSHSGA